MMLLTRWALLVIILTARFTSPAEAEPIRYVSSFAVGSFGGSDPLGLAGSTITLDMTWDAAPLTHIFDGPLFDGTATTWPSSNTAAVITISGSTGGADGTHLATVAPGDHWQLENDTTLQAGDNVQFPRASLTLLGSTFRIVGMRVSFLPTFNVPPPPGLIVPFAYNDTDIALVQRPRVDYSSFVSFSNTTQFHSQASVPEPNGIALAGMSLAALVGIVYRRRRV